MQVLLIYTINLQKMIDKYNLKDDLKIFDLVEKTDYVNYKPNSKKNYSQNKTTINYIPSEKIHLNLEDSYLEIKLQVTKMDDSECTDKNNIQPSVYYPLSLFDERSLELNHKPLEWIATVHESILMLKMDLTMKTMVCLFSRKRRVITTHQYFQEIKHSPVLQNQVSVIDEHT